MYDIDKKKFGAFISERRKQKGFTQKELAEHLFISDKAVSKWETGVSLPDAALWIPLAEKLGVTVTELLMCQCIESANQMNTEQVETLVKQAIRFSDETPTLTKQVKRQRILIFCTCFAISFLENLFLYSNGAIADSSIVIELLGIIFGFYFFFLVKEKLPAYYDENKISSYSDGIFRMNVPGLAFNNSNWPHIINVGRIWTMTILVGYPAVCGTFSLLFPAVWSIISLFVTLLIVLGGLFLPLYIVGNKYQ